MPIQTQKKIRSLGVLTGGGDVPGLNAVIKALVYRAEPLGISILGLRSGWEGITYLDRTRGRDGLIFRAEDPATWQGHYLMPLNMLNTSTIDRQGGTILQSTRTNPAKVKVGDLPAHLAAYGAGHDANERIDLTEEVITNLNFLELDGLVVIGGDDTLSYGAVLASKGIPVWGIPKTMDNDVPGTDYCIGFQTAITRATEFINRIRSTMESHSQTVLFRIFGRDAGFTTLETAIAAWADRALIPEVPSNIDRLAELVLQDRHNPHHASTVLLAEGANLGMPVPEVGEPDAYGHRKKADMAEFLAAELSARVKGVRFLTMDLTYYLRAGEPVVHDKRMAIFYANMAMSAVEKGMYDVMCAYRNGSFIYTDIPSKKFSARRINPADYDANLYRPRLEAITGPYEPQP